MILATADKVVTLGSAKTVSKEKKEIKEKEVSSRQSSSSSSWLPSPVCGPPEDQSSQGSVPEPEKPLSAEEIQEFSRIKCCICDTCIDPKDISEHSRTCVVAPAPNHVLQLDKWSIAVSSMTEEEQLQFIQMRRKEERTRVEEIEEEMKLPVALWWFPGKFCFIISSKWMRDWRAFVGVGHSSRPRNRPPGPICNTDLLTPEGQICRNLKRGLDGDYVVLEQPLWNFYYQIYSGGPPILRCVRNFSDTALDLSDMPPCEFEGDWKDRRPDMGKGKIFDSCTNQGFDGILQNGYLYSGFGRCILANGSYYEGWCEDGVPQGKGVETIHDGTVLEGTFVEGKLHGHGIQRNPDRSYIDGEWDHGVLCGI